MSFSDLPPEVLGIILTFVYHSYPTYIHRRESRPIKYLGAISLKVRNVVKHTPSLHTIINATSLSRYHLAIKRIRLQAQWSGSLPLSLILQPGYSLEATLGLLEPHRARWQALTFFSSRLGSKSLADPLPFLDNPLPALRSLEFIGQPNKELSNLIVDAPMLDTLACVHQPVGFKDNIIPQITSLTTVWEGWPCLPPIPLRIVLGLAHLLQELRISGPEVQGWIIDSSFPTDHPQFPVLRRLTFDIWGPVPCAILERFDLPKLLHLDIHRGSGFHTPRPLPILHGLRSLVWEESTGATNLTAFESILHACPSITALSILNIKEAERFGKLKELEASKKSAERKKLKKKLKKSKEQKPPAEPDEPKPLLPPMVQRCPNQNDAVAALVDHPEFCPNLQDVRLHHARLYQLTRVINARPSLQSIAVEACYDTDFVDQDGALHVKKIKMSIWDTLQSAEPRVRLEFPPNVTRAAPDSTSTKSDN